MSQLEIRLDLLTDSVAPELLLMETKWASLVSYGLTAQVLKDFLPVDATLNATTVQNHTLTVAQRCEDELGEEQWAFIEGCPADWGCLPIPDGPITVGIDGGYVRDWDEKKGHFEVIVGKSILAFRRAEEAEIPSSKCFGFVQTLDSKPIRLKDASVPMVYGPTADECNEIRRFRHHLLVCTGPRCTVNGQSEALFKVMARRLKDYGLDRGADAVRQTRCNCFLVCSGGPIVVVYPDNVWYRKVTPELLDRIITEHLKNGTPVQEHVYHQG